MKLYTWNEDKNQVLKAQRNISFDDELFLKTIIPSRKATRKYLRGQHENR